MISNIQETPSTEVNSRLHAGTNTYTYIEHEKAKSEFSR